VPGLQDDVQNVVDVPVPHPELPHKDLKVLQTTSRSIFYILDLGSRTVAPLETEGTPSLVVSLDGARVWAFQQGGSQLAALDVTTLHPLPLYVDRPIAAVFDVARDSGVGRSLIALHADGDVGATVFDAISPDTATARSYSALLLEGL